MDLEGHGEERGGDRRSLLTCTMESIAVEVIITINTLRPNPVVSGESPRQIFGGTYTVALPIKDQVQNVHQSHPGLRITAVSS